MKFIAGLRVWGNGAIGKTPQVFPRIRGSANRRVDLHLPLIASIPCPRRGALESLADRRRRAEKTAQSLLFPTARPSSTGEMGLERNRSAVGKTANSLVSPRPQQLTPLPCGGPARPLPGTKAIRRANFRLGHAGRRARTVSGCVNSAFHNISQHFTGHLFRPWIPNLTRCQHFLSSLGPFLAA